MESKKATIHDIAAKLNMSASTISRALNDYKRISKKTRDLVKQTALEMNYKPNHLASNLRKGKGKMIGVIVPRINRHFFSHAIAGMETITNPAGYNLIICQTNEELENEKRSLQTLLNNRVDGIVISISTETRDDEHIKSAIAENIPIVFFDRVLDNFSVDYVKNDNFFGAYEATKHLVDQGYRRIVHFSGPLHLNVYNDRLRGYKKAMEENRLTVSDDMVFDDVLTLKKGESVAKKLFSVDQLPDAIFSASDYSALGVLLFLKKQGVEIPKQIGIAGFSNEPFTEMIEPGLTTVEQYSEEIGKNAARMLIERLENRMEEGFSSTVTFKPKLIVRQSTLKQEK